MGYKQTLSHNTTQQILCLRDTVHHSTFMTGHDDIKVFLCSHAQNFDLEVCVEIKVRRAPHELFLKKGVPH